MYYSELDRYGVTLSLGLRIGMQMYLVKVLNGSLKEKVLLLLLVL